MNDKILAKKIEEVNAVKDKIQRAKTMVLIDYKGLNVLQDNELRNNFRNANVEYKVIKNKIMLKAFEGLNIQGFDDYLNGPTSVAFSYDDAVAPAKIISDYISKVNKMSVKAGMCEGKHMDATAVKNLAKIPSKETLIGQLLGLLTNPARSLAVVLNEVAKTKA